MHLHQFRIEIFFCNLTKMCVQYFLIELNDPKPKIEYLEMNENMDKMAHWTYFIFTKLTLPIFILSNLLLTAVNYFVLDMGEESYFLPSPILYVKRTGVQ